MLNYELETVSVPALGLKLSAFSLLYGRVMNESLACILHSALGFQP